MKTKTIEDIGAKIVELKNNLDNFRNYHRNNATDMNALSYGGETEYSINGLVCGVRNIIKDLEFLTKSHNLFIKFLLLVIEVQYYLICQTCALISKVKALLMLPQSATEIDSLKTIYDHIIEMRLLLTLILK